MKEGEIGSDVRLIERWLPIAALSEESVRERRSMTALPPIYYLHVWWARRPLVTSRAAVLGSLLPASVDHFKFQHALGIHGDPVATKRRIDRAKKTGEDLGLNPYGYKRAFLYNQSEAVSLTFGIPDLAQSIIVDPTAGGGSIPLEALRLGVQTIANDLNPVAAVILEATTRYPFSYKSELADAFEGLAAEFRRRLELKLVGVYPVEPTRRVDGYLWARTITCPYCSGLVPLSLSWRLNGNGKGVRLKPHLMGGPNSLGRRCDFEIVGTAEEQSAGTASNGDATCPFTDCDRVIDSEEVKHQAQAGQMGDQLYAVVAKRRIVTRKKSGKAGKPKWVRFYRPPRPEDNNSAEIAVRLAEAFHEWEALDVVPNESFPSDTNDDRPRQYGMPLWRDMFSPRQLLGHGLAAQIFRGMVEDDRATGQLTDLRRAAYVYLSFSLDKLRDYNSRMTRWHSKREVMVNTFDSHDFSIKWSYAEMAIMIEGLGLDWAIEQTGKCIRELVELASCGDDNGPLFREKKSPPSPPVTITAKPGANLDHIPDGTVDAVVMVPPYGANVMYAELSDFFYVWLKRTAGLVVPEFFTRRLTDKHLEAVANKARFKGQKGADALATRDYQEKMAAIFTECRRILKSEGILTVMFTHKETSAWDALTKGLIEAGFIVTASWPVNTEVRGIASHQGQGRRQVNDPISLPPALR